MIAQPYSELSDQELLALCTWREADDQSVAAMAGVAHVVNNRVKLPRWWGVSVQTVVLKPWQFSCFDHGDPNESRWPEDENVQWLAVLHIATAVLAGTDRDLTDGASSYYDVSIDPPSWTAELVFTVQFDRIRFYKLPMAVSA
jgi:spore germination cell wall hydrolase CwlJ-like protein